MVLYRFLFPVEIIHPLPFNFMGAHASCLCRDRQDACFPG